MKKNVLNLVKKSLPFMAVALVASLDVNADATIEGLNNLNTGIKGIAAPLRTIIMSLGSVGALGCLGYVAFAFFFNQQQSKPAVMGLIGGLLCIGVASVM